MNEATYAPKNALLYTLLVAAILLAPLYIYAVYLKSTHDVGNELTLKAHADIIITRMEEFGALNEPTFEFPRFALVKAGLYDRNFQPVFSLIEAPLERYSPGYHEQDGIAYYVRTLPENRYFNAAYLITLNEVSYIGIYQKVVLVLLIISGLVFALSLFFLNRFAQPFKLVNRKLDRFIKDSIHEINTPLSIINVNVDLFNRQNETNKYMQRIKAAAKTLSTIYNDMDCLIKEQTKDFTVTTIQLDRVLKERIEYFKEVAALKAIEIRSDIEARIFIDFSEEKLQRVIDNNISNAIKYSHDNAEIMIVLERVEAGCLLRFRDRGVGIREPKRIFERYYRENMEKGGFGIGLNIVKQIIDDAGIELKVESEVGEGSTFSYLIPSSLIRAESAGPLT